MARSRGRTIERREAERAAEAERLRSAQARKRRLRTASVGTAVAAAVVAFVVFDRPLPGVAIPTQGNLHLSSPTEPHAPYNSSPPTSGPHFGGLANWGESSDPIPPEVFVHNLEDRGVVIAYDCIDCADFIAKLRGVMADHHDRRILMTPFEGIRDTDGTARKGAVAAWGRLLTFDSVDDSMRGEIDDFIRLFEGIDHHVGARTGGHLN